MISLNGLAIPALGYLASSLALKPTPSSGLVNFAFMTLHLDSENEFLHINLDLSATWLRLGNSIQPFSLMLVKHVDYLSCLNLENRMLYLITFHHSLSEIPRYLRKIMKCLTVQTWVDKERHLPKIAWIIELEWLPECTNWCIGAHKDLENGIRHLRRGVFESLLSNFSW